MRFSFIHLGDAASVNKEIPKFSATLVPITHYRWVESDETNPQLHHCNSLNLAWLWKLDGRGFGGDGEMFISNILHSIGRITESRGIHLHINPR